MVRVFLFLFALVLAAIVAIIVYKRQNKLKRIMHEGKLVKSEMVFQNGEQLYLEKVAFKDWHVCIHSFLLDFQLIGKKSHHLP